MLSASYFFLPISLHSLFELYHAMLYRSPMVAFLFSHADNPLRKRTVNLGILLKQPRRG